MSGPERLLGSTPPDRTTPETRAPAYLQLASSSGPPPPRDCDEGSERGRLTADTAGARLYLCADLGWVALAP